MRSYAYKKERNFQVLKNKEESPKKRQFVV